MTHAVLLDAPSNLYQQIVESAHEGIWTHDLVGQTTFANAQMANLLGYSLVEMSGLTIFDLLDSLGQRQAAEMLARERAGPLTEQVDCCYLRRDGSPVWCLVSRSPLRDSDGRHIGCINLVSDITERKQLDESLRRSGEMLAEAQRVAHLGSWGWDVTGSGDIDWSEESYRIMGRSELTPPTYEDYLNQVHPDDREAVNRLVLESVENQVEFTYECRIVRPSGQTVWVHAEGESVKDSTGTLRSLRGTILDITAYKNAEERVRRTSARYRLLQKMATEANRDSGFEHALGVAVQEILRYTEWPIGQVCLVSGTPPRLVPARLQIPGAEGSSVEDGELGPRTVLSAQVLATRRSKWTVRPEPTERWRGEPSSRCEAGFAFPVLVDGEVVAVLEFLSGPVATVDEELLETCEQVGSQLARVVARQRAADELAAARDAAMESLRVKSEFLATMSHEIRTPMNGVIGLTQLLLDTQLEERQRQYAEGVQVAGESLLTVINDILDFSKLEAGKVELDREDFEVRRLVEEVAALLAPTAYAKGLELLAYCLPDVPVVLLGDSGRIRQILLNLVSNAVKFTAAGEVVTKVTSSPTPDGAVRLRVEVRDTGIGIPEHSRDRLFESFSQADASTTRRYGGTGLGLAISQRLVQAMDGTIDLDSDVGVGSTFWFEIPLTVGTTVPSRPVTLLPDHLTGSRVLVVDDNATNRMILASQLGSWGLESDGVDSGSTALAQLRAMAAKGEPYDIAVLDMCMPDLDGLELAGLVSGDDALTTTRLIMLTSSSEVDPTALGRAGIGEWLIKPVRSSDLYDRLLRLMAPPVTTEPAPAAPARTVSTGSALMGRVLVVEDNPLNQLVAQGIVTSLGYSVDIVANGAEALRAVLHTSYAVVLMDCHMPVLDGFEATREIRRREGNGERIPVIAMTAGAMADDRVRCSEAGMDDFLSKPVTRPAVEAALTRWIGTQPVPERTAPAEAETDRPPWADEPAVDPNRVTQLRQLGSMGGTDLLGRVVELFARDGAVSLASIREATATHRAEELREALHKLKGTAANMGANRVAALCREFEEPLEVETAEPGPTTVLLTQRQLELLAAELELADRAIGELSSQPHLVGRPPAS